MSDVQVPVIIQPSVPYRPFHLFHKEEAPSYLQSVLEEYLGVIHVLSQLKAGQKIGIVLNPLIVKWLESDSFQMLAADLLAKSQPEANDPAKQALFEQWNHWDGQLIHAFRFYIRQGKLKAYPSAISDYPLTVLQSAAAMEIQLEKTLQIWQAAFQSAPESIWLPRGAYAAGIERILQPFGVKYLFLSHEVFSDEVLKKGGICQTVYGMGVCPVAQIEEIEQMSEFHFPVFAQIAADRQAFFSQLLNRLPEQRLTKRTHIESCVHIPFSYFHLNKGGCLLNDEAAEHSAAAFQMEEKLALLEERLPDEERFLKEALIQEWIHYLYAIAHRLPREEQMNCCDAFSYIYEGIIRDECDYDYIGQRSKRLLIADGLSLREKQRNSHWLRQEKKGVLMLTWEYPPRIVGGLSRHVHDLSKALCYQEVEVYVVTAACPGQPAYETDEGVHVFRTGPLHACEPDFLTWIADLNGCLLRKAVEIIGENSIQIIHAHDWLVGHAALVSRQLFQIPLITTVHATEYGRNNGIFTEMQTAIYQKEKSLFDQSDRLIVCSQPMKEEVLSWYLEEEKEIDIIPNGINTDEMKLEEKLDHKKKQPYIFSIGRIVREKGFHLLIEAAAYLSGKYDLQFIIAGTGPLLDHFRKKVKQRKLEDAVHFIGFVSDEERRRLFLECEAAVFPSLYEPFGIVALEAMAAQKPVVASCTGGLKSFVIHEETGLLFTPGDVQSLQKQLERLMRDHELKERMERKGYRLARDVYSWPRISSQTKRVYDRSVVKQKMEGVFI
ncbi:glycosyltransferase [Bacillus xiapuensis]|uniref:glycosyltransferase n=1 Tax=Bacillus xiapuensis TaxID=2014075 RepID=UPI0018E1DD43|nr:glycosyltransferase [Bacillus xiapuensis]